MSNTFLSHSEHGCTGSIYLDCQAAMKLIAPSFSINSGGIGSIVLDIDVTPSNRLQPVFCCRTCGETITNVGECLSVFCQICGKSKMVSDTFVHSDITTICSSCLGEIKSYCKTGKTSVGRLPDFVSTFNLRSSIKVVPLVDVLSSPIEI